MASTTLENRYSIAKTIAIVGSTAAAGGFGVVSLMTIPAFLLAPRATAAAQFAHIYRIGYVTQPPLTILTTLAGGFVAYREFQHSAASWSHWAVSSALIGTILPWTFILMEPVSHQILEVANEAAKPVDSTKKAGVTNLLRRWHLLNMARGAMAMGAGLVAVYSMASA